MVLVVIVSVTVTVVVVVKGMVRDGGIISMVSVVEVLVIVFVWKSALPVSCSVDMPSGVDADLFMDEEAAKMRGVITRIVIEVFTDVSANAFAVIVTALEFPVSTPLEEFGR